MVDKERVEELEKQIADMVARLPKHSVPPAMLIELDELEDALERLRRRHDGVAS